jgi:orotate phosphoribosyltransferase-like protein
MAKERISNETLAKVLVKAVEDLQEKLKGMEIILGKHSGLVADTLKKPVPIDNQALEESMQKLHKIEESLKDTIRQGKQDLTKPFWLWIAGICFATLLVAIGLFVYNSSHNKHIEELERKAKELEEKILIINSVERYFDEHQQQFQEYEKWRKGNK